MISNPCHRHGHDHRSGLGRSCKRSIFIGVNRNAIHRFSAPKIFDSSSIPPPRACPSFGFWADVASNQFLYESTESPSKTCRSRKFLIANPCRRHGHAHRSGLGRSCTRSVFIGTNRIAIQKFSAPKILKANLCRRHGHDHRSGLGRPCKRSVLIGSNRIAIQKISVPKSFDKQSLPPPWA